MRYRPWLRTILVLGGVITVLSVIIIEMARWRSDDLPPSPWIAYGFSSQDHRGIYLMRPDGSEAQPLARVSTSARFPTWSPDGRWIVFSESDRSLIPAIPGELYLVHSNGHDLKLLVSTSVDDYAAQWSPDNRWIAFLSGISPNYGLYLVRPDGKDLHPLVLDVGPYSNFAWSPDGKWISFTSSANSPDSYVFLYRVRIDDGQVERVTEISGSCVIWSPDGQWLYFLHQVAGKSSVFRVYPDGSHLQELFEFSRWGCLSDWSPDGQWILYNIAGDNGYDIAKMRFDGSEDQWLTKREFAEVDGAWSPPVSSRWHWGALLGVGLAMIVAGLSPRRFG